MTLLILLGWVNYKNWDSKIVIIALICLATALLFLFAYHHNTNFNAEGLKKYIRIAGFLKMLHDTSDFKNSQLGDLTLWKDILPYAAGLGLAPKVLERLHQEFSTLNLFQRSVPITIFIMMTKMAKTFMPKFTQPSQMLVAVPATEVLHPVADLEVPVTLAAVPATVRFRVNKRDCDNHSLFSISA